MEEAEQSSLDPSLGLMSLPLHIDSKRSGYITTRCFSTQASVTEVGTGQSSLIKYAYPVEDLSPCGKEGAHAGRTDGFAFSHWKLPSYYLSALLPHSDQSVKES